MKNPRRQRIKEHHEQRQVVEWLWWRGVGCFSVPNGVILGGRNKYAQLNKLKAEGFLPGAPDLVVMGVTPDGRPVAIEMKRAQGGEFSPEQLLNAQKMRVQGWVVLQSEGAQQCIAQLEELGF